jgi:hypothetical protein
MSTPFLNLPEADGVARIQTVASAAVGEPVVVRIGERGWRRRRDRCGSNITMTRPFGSATE